MDDSNIVLTSEGENTVTMTIPIDGETSASTALTAPEYPQTVAEAEPARISPDNPQPSEVPLEEPNEQPPVLPGEVSQAAITSEEPKPKHAGGRPCEYCKDKEAIQQKADAYLERSRVGVNGKAVMPYLEELAMELNKYSDTVTDWSTKRNVNGELEHPEFFHTIKKINDIQKLRLQQRTLGRYNPTGAIFLLKVNHKFIETEKQILTGDKNEPLEITITEDKPRSENE